LRVTNISNAVGMLDIWPL